MDSERYGLDARESKILATLPAALAKARVDWQRYSLTLKSGQAYGFQAAEIDGDFVQLLGVTYPKYLARAESVAVRASEIAIVVEW